jgi:hypothetical protein
VAKSNGSTSARAVEEKLNYYKTIQKGMRSCIEMHEIALNEIQIAEKNGKFDLAEEILAVLDKAREFLTAKEIHNRAQTRLREKKSQQIKN